MSSVSMRKGEPVAKALRVLKKKMDYEGTIKELRRRRYYEKPSEIKRRENKRASKRNSRSR